MNKSQFSKLSGDDKIDTFIATMKHYGYEIEDHDSRADSAMLILMDMATRLSRFEQHD